MCMMNILVSAWDLHLHFYDLGNEDDTAPLYKQEWNSIQSNSVESRI